MRIFLHPQKRNPHPKRNPRPKRLLLPKRPRPFIKKILTANLKFWMIQHLKKVLLMMAVAVTMSQKKELLNRKKSPHPDGVEDQLKKDIGVVMTAFQKMMGLLLVCLQTRIFTQEISRSHIRGIPSQTGEINLTLREGRKDISNILWHLFFKKTYAHFDI